MTEQLVGQQTICPTPEPPPLVLSEHYAALDKTRFKIENSGSGACSECFWVCYEADRRGKKGPPPRRARHHWGTRADRVELCDGHKQMWEAQIPPPAPKQRRAR